MVKLVQPDRPIWPPFPDEPNEVPPSIEDGLQGGTPSERIPQAEPGYSHVTERKELVRPAILPGS